MNIKCLVLLCLSLYSLNGYSQESCTNREYLVYQKYDALLEAFPNTSTTDLRNRFAREIGMTPTALRALHTRCTVRWANQNPREAAEYARKGMEDLKKDCATRPASDPICRSLTGK